MRYLTLAIMLLSTSLDSPASAQGMSAPSDLITTCESCHGPGGNGTTPATPRLNGQLSPYIVTRLQELADLTKNSIHATLAMYDIAHMKEPLKVAIADYFSHQTPTPARPEPGKLAARGQRLYVNGDRATGVPACQSCHGSDAEGRGNIPRLAGQHRDYLKTQLWDFSFATREHTVMNANAVKLSPDQIDELVAWLGAD